MGAEMLGIGSDLCQNRSDYWVQWMRDGRWRKVPPTTSEASKAKFPEPTSWFSSNRDFPGIAQGLRDVGFSEQDVDGIMGGNWLRFFDQSFTRAAP